MTAIQFKSKLSEVNGWTILHLPKDASAKLPSRGMVMVEGILNEKPFKAMLEPDGKYGPGLHPSHWFRLEKDQLKEIGAKAGDLVAVSLSPTKDIIEPDVPEDLVKALAASPKAKELWVDITPNARWEWIRWIRAVKSAKAREKHIQVALDKLNKGMRRPCCFNRNMCSVPEISHNWVLLDSK